MSETNSFNPAPTPKARFMESGDNCSKHKQLLENPALQRALDFALLQYQAALAQNQPTMNDAATSGIKMAGALEFIDCFKKLAEKPSPLPSRLVTPANLDHSLLNPR